MLKQATLIGYDSGNCKATIKLRTSHQRYLEGVAVACNIPEVELVAGRKLMVSFLDEYIPGEAVVIAVYE